VCLVLVYSILETAYVLKSSCFQYTVYQDPADLSNCSTKKCIYFDYMTLLHHVSCVLKWLIWLYAVYLWFDSPKKAPWGLKHVGMCSVVMQYKYLRNDLCICWFNIVNDFIHFLHLGFPR